MPIAAPLAPDETFRIEALKRYKILDTDPDLKFDRVTGLASELFGAPICLVSLVDTDRQWFKSCVGLDVREAPRELAFCAYAILGDEVFVVPDATKDVRFADNPLVLGSPHIRTYAGAPLVTKGGAHLGTLCLVYSDVTEIPPVWLRQLRTLADIVEDALELHLAVEEAEDARVAAEQSAIAKTRFLANMSHEIRTPLNGVIGMLNLLTSSALQDSVRDQVDMAYSAAHDLLTLLNDILDYSKLDSGNLQLDPMPMDFGQAAGQIVTLFEPIAAEKDLTLTLSIDPAVPGSATGDPTRFRQVLTNLVSNALKFTRHGGVDVRMTYSAGDGDREGKIRCEVADTGIGVASETAAYLFERFTQADSSTTREFGGTGLGLAICAELVDLMAGSIGVEGKPGEGSIFWFEIPAPPVEAPSLSDGKDHSGPGNSHSWRRLRVLVAEDNYINQRLLQVFVGNDGHDVTIVGDGGQAIERLLAETFDLILMDDQMPEMDGVTAVRKIRALAGPLSDIPIIMITANVTDGDREKYLAAGATDYVTKPVDPRILSGVMQHCVVDRPAV